MIKSGIYLLSFLALLSCAATKMTKNESFLSINSSKEKIYILSVLPLNGEKASTYISTLLVGHSAAGKHQFSAIASYYDEPNDTTQNKLCFIDSLPNWGSKRFPILVQSFALDSARSNFQFSMDRNSTELNARSEEVGISYHIHFKRQKEFGTKVIGTPFQLSRIEPLGVDLKQLNDTKTHQSSIFFLHTLEKPESLFETQLHYYWIDFQLFNEATFSMFLSSDKNGVVQVIYSSYPSEKYQSITINDDSLVSDEVLLLEFIGTSPLENLQVNAFDHTNVSPKTSVAKPIQIMQANVEVGNGILYKL